MPQIIHRVIPVDVANTEVDLSQNNNFVEGKLRRCGEDVARLMVFGPLP
jgi:hypothetical protein